MLNTIIILLNEIFVINLISEKVDSPGARAGDSNSGDNGIDDCKTPPDKFFIAELVAFTRKMLYLG